jgi:hypothetical protein
VSLPELIGASDVCLADTVAWPGGARPSCGQTAVSLAISMGVPVVSQSGGFEGFAVTRAASHQLGRIAVPICGILESVEMRNRLAAEGRAWSGRERGADGFGTTLEALWHEVSNIPWNREREPALIS